MFLKPFWLWTPYLLQKTIEKCQYNVLQISGFFRSVSTGDPLYAEAAFGTSCTDDMDCSGKRTAPALPESRASEDYPPN
jgi:hypothetical protein